MLSAGKYASRRATKVSRANRFVQVDQTLPDVMELRATEAEAPADSALLRDCESASPALVALDVACEPLSDAPDTATLCACEVCDCEAALYVNPALSMADTKLFGTLNVLSVPTVPVVPSV